MNAFFSAVKNFFSHQDAAAEIKQISPIVTALLGVLHAFGLAGNHVTAIVQDVVNVANNASGTLSGAEKLSVVSVNVAKLATDAGLEKAASAVTTIAQIGYQLAKAQGLLK